MQTIFEYLDTLSDTGYIVIGVVAIIFMILYRKQIAQRLIGFGKRIRRTFSK